MISGSLAEARSGYRTALLGCAVGFGSIIALATSAMSYRLGQWPVTTALSFAEYAAYAAGLGLAISAVALVLALRRRASLAIALGLFGLFASLPVAAVAVHWEYASRAYPPINDISTDTENPPVFWDMPNPSEYLGGRVAELQRAAYPDLAPLALSLPPARAFEVALALAEERGWKIIAEEPEDGRIEAVETTLIYGFKDEIVIRIEPAESGAVIDLRSRSRLGRIDRGMNAARIRSFLERLRERSDEAG